MILNVICVNLFLLMFISVSSVFEGNKLFGIWDNLFDDKFITFKTTLDRNKEKGLNAGIIVKKTLYI